jgi:uncharacterized protein YoxC
MKAERARLKRLLRLENVRAIARQTLAAEAAQAEGTLAQLEALASRTQRLVLDYSTRRDPDDGLAMRQLGQFTAGLQDISQATRGDANQARVAADRKHDELATAERSRAAAEDRAERQARRIASRSAPAALGTRRGFGTGLE